ncbi:MAG: class I SAM-dependent methyltransferase [Solirubrobacteraceae bacterium]|nr:class I SAM-dependent methyltransferase [Solirubrobacteraceae bacterium]
MRSRSSSENVYATAKQGWRARAASAVSGRARARRHARLFALTGVTPDSRILDVGCGRLGLRRHAPGHDVTGVDRVPRPDYPGPFVQADVLQGLPFADGEFELAYCSSVIEHVAIDDRAAFAAELRRVAHGWYVQTPAFSFPLEPHALLPFAHWLPLALRRPYWRLGVAGEWEQIDLLRRAEMARLFGEPVAERAGPLVKSWISVGSARDPQTRPALGAATLSRDGTAALVPASRGGRAA